MSEVLQHAEAPAADGVTLTTAGFLGAPGFLERIDLVQRNAGTRLSSHQLAEVWAHVLALPALRDDPASLEILLREMLQLSPQHDRIDTLYGLLMTPWDPAPDPLEPVFMIVSCARLLPRAHRLHRQLSERGALAWIVLGDPDMGRPRWQASEVRVGAPDTYEALPLKVALGVNAIVQRHGPRSIVKIDDDCSLLERFDPAVFRHVAERHDYVGVAVGDPLHDRLWHHRKTSVPLGPYTRRYRGQWARGACYLLGPRAAAVLAREAALHPGEFSGEYYEDKAVGECMRQAGIRLQGLPGDEVWGITYDRTERYAPEGTAPAG